MRPAADKLVLILLAAALVTLALPAVASAAFTWDVGGAQGFSGTLSNLDVVNVRGADVLRLKRRVVWQFTTGKVFDPRTAMRLANGNTLVCDGNNVIVSEYSRSGSIVWSFSTRDDPKLSRPFSAERLTNGNTLICDRTGYRVIEVDPAKRIVWQYGTGQPAVGIGQLIDPFSARRLPNGDTLICDNREGFRVIEVRSSDYSPSKPNLGYSAGSVVWKYGTGVGGVGPGQIASPRQAERLSNGNTLIADEWGNRIIEVNRAGAIVWSFGVPGQQGSDGRHLNAPCSMTRLADGRTLIDDKDNRRLLWVNPDGTIDSSYGLGPTTPDDGGLLEARTVQVTASGTTLIADNAAHRLIEIGYVPSGRYETGDIDLRMPGVKKWLTSLAVTADRPSATAVEVSYSLDGGSWKKLGAQATMEFPSPTTCRFVRMRFGIETTNADHTPSLRVARVAYDVTAPPPKPPSSTGGSTTQHPSSSGTTGNGSGTASQRRYTWGWGSTDGGGSAGGGAQTGGSGSGGSEGSPSTGDFSIAGGSAAGGASRTGWLLKEIAPGPAEGQATSSGSSAAGGSGSGTKGGVSAETAAQITRRTGRTASIVTLLTLGLAYAAGTLSGTLKNAAHSIAGDPEAATPGLEA